MSQEALPVDAGVARKADESRRPLDLLTGLTVVIAVAAVLATLLRLLYGADWIDETFYATAAYRFAMGGRPFITDIDVHQLAALLVAPYVKLHLLLFGGTTGLLLSLRLLWAALNGVAAFAWYRALRRMIDWRLALLGAVTGFMIIPYMIPAPSFNTLHEIFGAIGIAVILSAAYSKTRSPWPYVGAGVSFGIATVAYPSIVIAAIVAVALLAVLSRSWRPFLLVAAGAGAVGVAIVLSLLPFISHVPTVLADLRSTASLFGWAGTGQGGLLGKVLFSWWHVLQLMAFQPVLWLSLVIAALQVLRRRVPYWLSVLTVASLVFAFPAAPEIRSLAFAITLLCCASVVLFSGTSALEDGDPLKVRLLGVALVYGLCSATVCVATSSNGWYFLGIGAIPAVAPSIAVLLERARTSHVPAAGRASVGVVELLLAGAVIASVGAANATASYRELPPTQLSVFVTRGPHAGLITSPTNKLSSEMLWDALHAYPVASSPFFAYHDMPAAYLFTTATPSTPAYWTEPFDAMGAPHMTDVILSGLRDRATAPGFIVKNLGLPFKATLDSNNASHYDPALDGVERFVEANYHEVTSTPTWALLKRN